jgi:hypothetical protein
MWFLKMTPSEIKEAQHKRYDEKAAAIVRGEDGYKPAEKSRYSKSCKLSSKHIVSFFLMLSDMAKQNEPSSSRWFFYVT